MYVCVCSVAQSCLTLWGPTECKLPGPLFMEFSRQEYWSGLLFPTPGDLPEQEIEAESPALADGFFTTSATWEALYDPASLLLGSFPKRNENMLTQWAALKYSTRVFLIARRRNNPVIQQLVYRWKKNKRVYLHKAILHDNKKKKSN